MTAGAAAKANQVANPAAAEVIGEDPESVWS
jgi:hypothetical protein